MIPEKKENKRTERIKFYWRTSIIHTDYSGAPTEYLSTVLISWCSWHHASTRKSVDLTSPVFDLFSHKSFKKKDANKKYIIAYFSNRPWSPSGLSRHVSNSSRDRCLGLRFKSPLRRLNY